MFLTKKNAAYLNKPPKGKVITPRVLAGWGDDDDLPETFDEGYSNHNYPPQMPKSDNLLDDLPTAN